MATNRVLLSYPFSAGLYAFFAEEMGRGKTGQGPPRVKHCNPYYRTLFGDRFQEYEDIAVSLALLFDQIVLPPADTYLPATRDEHGSWRNPDLGIEVHWGEYSELHEEAEDFVALYLEDSAVDWILARVPDIGRRIILRACHYEIYKAKEIGCPIVCGEGRRALLERIVAAQASRVEIQGCATIRVLAEYLKLFVPWFHRPEDIDTLCEIKQIKSLREYAQAFYRVMNDLTEQRDVRRVLAAEMLEAMDSVDLSERLAGGYDTASTVLSIAGLLPAIGSAASVASLGFVVGAKQRAQEARAAKWFEFAPEIMKQIQYRDLRRSLEAELGRDACK